MKIDTTGREIRRLADQHGLRYEVEQIQTLDGEARRFWFFCDRLGRPPIGGEGSGIQDQEALNFLQEAKP
ncbi:MAG: hypothetical protein ACYDBT_09965 [Desulfobulbaceae bacterium]